MTAIGISGSKQKKTTAILAIVVVNKTFWNHNIIKDPLNATNINAKSK